MRASDQGFERRLHTTTVDEQRLAVLDPQWGAAHPPPWPKLGKGTGPEVQHIRVRTRVAMRAEEWQARRLAESREEHSEPFQ